jgi:hypothetical protein
MAGSADRPSCESLPMTACRTPLGSPRSPTGVVLCGEPCGLLGACRMGVLAARGEDDDSVSFDIECPADYRESPDLAQHRGRPAS